MRRSRYPKHRRRLLRQGRRFGLKGWRERRRQEVAAQRVRYLGRQEGVGVGAIPVDGGED